MDSRRGASKPSFADIVAAERARPAADPQDGRARNRVTAHQLWDDSGRRWSQPAEITPADADRLIADDTVRLGLCRPGDRRLEWFTTDERKTAWRRFRPRLQEFGAGIPPGGGIGYVPQLWTRADGSRLLLLQVLC
ncbi:hypothetical protein ODJ79_14330 [Actinoplanes sp. KI2]|uniref:hypothetical protein n=1 Tax=Actinoplanes sp. KI2 TaxID=2983315 RepID=UPI0021D5AC33|nr:hypothetical protein [Actinoplanes sp. KI2]MCU7724900.1 hypothetical protein [Actinoplanes sp. KI2]